MPASISHSSMLPKFPDKQRRPGIIHLPQPITSPLRPTTKLPVSNTNSKNPQKPEQTHPHTPNKAQQKGNANVNNQLRTPSPSPRRNNNGHQSRHRQRRSVNNADISAIAAATSVMSAASGQAPQDPSLALVDSAAGDGSAELAVRPAGSAGILPLSPPPTPKVRAPKQRKGKAKTPPSSLSVRRGAKPAVPASPPLTPEVAKFAPVEEAVFSLDISAVDLAQDSNDSLPLADDDEVIVWKQPLTPTLPSPRADNTSTRSSSPSSPSEFVNWDDVKNLPKLSRATVAQLKEQYDIRPSKAFEQTPSSQEPDLLMSLLHASSSCPPSPGSGPEATNYPGSSKPIPITRRPNGSHVRAPSVPAYPTSGRLAMQQYKEDVAEAFGLDVRDVMAVQKATEAWRAYAGSTFNNSPETERVPAPKFLGRLFH